MDKRNTQLHAFFADMPSPHQTMWVDMRSLPSIYDRFIGKAKSIPVLQTKTFQQNVFKASLIVLTIIVVGMTIKEMFKLPSITTTAIFILAGVKILHFALFNKWKPNYRVEAYINRIAFGNYILPLLQSDLEVINEKISDIFAKNKEIMEINSLDVMKNIINENIGEINPTKYMTDPEIVEYWRNLFVRYLIKQQSYGSNGLRNLEGWKKQLEEEIQFCNSTISNDNLVFAV